MMDYKVEQLNSYTVVITLIGDVDLDELAQLYSDIDKDIIQPAPEKVYCIFEVSQVRNFSYYITQSQLASEKILKNKKVAGIFPIGIPNNFVNYLMTKTISPSQMRTYNVADMEEALALIETLRGKPASTSGD